VLIEGPSGAGKSDLALRALASGFRLVADDRVVVFACEGRLYGRAPDPLAGLIEARGVGVVGRDPLPFARVALVVSCVDERSEVDRLPEDETRSILDVAVPSARIWPFEPSAPGKLAALLEYLGGRPQAGYQARFAPPGGAQRRG
jgi:serine kinase of HPr protein (carbohydrate metabolism regulator)